MSDNISYVTEKIRNTAQDIYDAAEQYLAKIEELTGLVNGLESDWNGRTYNAFKNSYYTNKASIEGFAGELSTYGKSLGIVADIGDDTTRNIENYM